MHRTSVSSGRKELEAVFLAGKVKLDGFDRFLYDLF